VSYSAGRPGNTFHCVTIPTGCHGNPTCSCLGPSTCVSPVNSCSDYSGVKGIQCGCPTC
jgi:hypothetical protein